MRIGFLLLCFYALSSSVTQASTLIDIGSASCSGSESINSSNGLSFSCSGDFSLTAGSLSSDIGITLSSLGKLTLDGLTLSAPNITLNATNIDIGSSVLLDVSQGSLRLAGGGGILPFIPRFWPAPAVPSSLSGGVVTIGSGGYGDINIAYGGYGIDAGRGSIAAGISISSSGMIVPAAGIISLNAPLLPALDSSGAGIFISSGPALDYSGAGLTFTSAGPIATGTSIPLPGSFSALLTGLLMLASVSRHRIIRTAQ